ncbi:Os01g0909051 [Oryza sativa Japonica Group]|uniref:Os01g0909051 protein n=1 Tax=Oryza sativa subsp. japonica TaxID=39947 RepID=A0A0P0VBW5_ORYSJ|nr:Os01g0909051 [Oryza sativa Japonica Group]
MHTIAEVTGGTFSFIENKAAIQDGFAQYIGGLLNVAVQEFHFDAETWRGPDGPRVHERGRRRGGGVRRRRALRGGGPS